MGHKLASASQMHVEENDDWLWDTFERSFRV
jgi:hypothetical protein